MGSTFNSSIPGNDKAGNSSLTFYEDQHNDAIEQHLPKGAKGYVVLLRKGDIPGSRSVDVFPVQVATRAATYGTGNEAAKFKVDSTITEEPSLDAVVPEAFHTLPAPGDHDDEHSHHDHDGDHVDVRVVSTTKTAARRRRIVAQGQRHRRFTAAGYHDDRVTLHPTASQPTPEGPAPIEGAADCHSAQGRRAKRAWQHR